MAAGWWGAVTTEAAQALHPSNNVSPVQCRVVKIGAAGTINAAMCTPGGTSNRRHCTKYQPGGLGEKALLLRQLVDAKVPSDLTEFLDVIKGWRRSLRRAQELRVATPIQPCS